MLTLKDGKNSLYQYDIGVKIRVDVECDFLHFSNVLYGESVSVAVENNEAEIPNMFLAKAESFYVWAFVRGEGESYTVCQSKFDVKARPKPTEFVYSPTEVKTIETVVQSALMQAKPNFVRDVIEALPVYDGTVVEV